jgi:hypothetical protein
VVVVKLVTVVEVVRILVEVMGELTGGLYGMEAIVKDVGNGNLEKLKRGLMIFVSIATKLCCRYTLNMSLKEKVLRGTSHGCHCPVAEDA